MQLKFAHEGIEYTFDNTLSLAEAMLIKECAGLTAGQFLGGLGQMDGAALAGMVLLAKMRNGESTTWSDLASMDLVKVIESVGELNKPSDEPEPESINAVMPNGEEVRFVSDRATVDTVGTPPQR